MHKCPSETLTLRIHKHTFTISRRYTEGDTITAGEAQALNQLMLENIRNNTDSWVHKLESPSGTLTPTNHSDLQARIFAYACQYRFQVRKAPQKSSPYPLELAIHEIAATTAEIEGRQQLLDPSDPAVQLRYRQLLKDPEIIRKAHDLVTERLKALQDLKL